MKRIQLFILVVLLYYNSNAQNNTSKFNDTTQPITTNGITLPQLITTDLNRSTLKFHVNLSDGLSSPNLSASYQKFISDRKKQFSIAATAGIAHSLSFSETDNRDFYTMHGMHAALTTDLKLFNASDYFIQIGTQNLVFKGGSLNEFDFLNSNNSLTLGFGKGRIDYVNDGTAALNIVEQLKGFGILLKELTTEEHKALVELIRALKNRRKFVNRSYPLTEAEEIQELLLSFGVIDDRVNVIEVINEVYKLEPIINRTSGKQFKISATGMYSTRPEFIGTNNLSLAANISYAIHTPMSLNWQHDFKMEGYLLASENTVFDPTFEEDKIKRIGVKMSNDFHYLVNTNVRLSFKNSVGYNFKDIYFNPFPADPLPGNEGFFMNTQLQTQFQFNRTTSATFGINLNLSPRNTFTGLNLGLNF